MAAEVVVSPLRGLNDFLLDSARFQIPNVKDLDKWANRVVSNLLYYQTNYFLTAVIVFLVVGLMYPEKMLFGMFAIGVAFGIFYYVTNKNNAATRFKKEHPIINLLLIFGGGYFIVYVFGAVLVFIVGILLPLAIIFTHASFRLRNMRNKLSNKMESVGLKRTPMGILLDAVEIEFVGEM
ncbi:ARL6IP5 (predicted) [Pycnogonum litorale]